MKKTVSLLLVFLFALSLASCGKEKSDMFLNESAAAKEYSAKLFEYCERYF